MVSPGGFLIVQQPNAPGDDVTLQPIPVGMSWSEGPTEAPDSGAAVLPQDANTWGNNAGWLPQPPATAQELPRQNSVGLEIYIGVTQGTAERALDAAKSLVLNALTFGGYGTLQLGKAIWAGYHEDRYIGALNAVNPLYQLARGGADTYMAAEDGNYRAAGAAGVKTVVIGVAAVVGAAQGMGTLAGRGAAAGVARGPAATRELAQHVANAEKLPMSVRRTVTVLETREGPTLVAGGASDLSPAQIKAAKRLDLTPAPPMPGLHAEPTAIFGAGELGLTPVRGATTNIICAGPGGCTGIIESLGGRITSPHTYEF